MTEDEAKTKWCPFVRVAVPEIGPSPSPNTVVGNRYEYEGDDDWNHCHCLGSACMAWRWLNPGETFDEWRQKAYGYKVETKDAVAGYCGLSGKP